MKTITFITISLFISINLYAGTYSGGSGTSGDPYKIATTDDLIELSNTSGDWSWNKYFIQTANISFDEDETQVDWDGDNDGGSWDAEDQKGFSPIGNGSTPAECTYDGQNHTIENLYINRPTTNDVGLFGWKVSEGIINLGVVNADINGQNNVGAVAGKNLTLMANCFSTGTISGAENVGGLVGKNYTQDGAGYSTIEKSYSLCDVSGTNNIGGFIGYNYNYSEYADADISYCWSSGDVTRTSGTNTSFGAFCGNNYDGAIYNSYANGSVFEPDGATVLGTDNGFVGTDNSGSYSNNFFDTDVSNQSTGTGATGKTTAQMQTKSTFTNAGWDFTNTWAMSSSITFGGYPTLQWTGAYAEAPTNNQIASLSNLVWIAEDNNNWSGDYTQTADINAWTTPSWDDGKGWTPIGNSTTTFSGSYDGQGYSIKSICIDRADPYIFIGFFGISAYGTTITNLSVINVDITGEGYTGGLLGVNFMESLVSNCHTTGRVVNNSAITDYSTGGIVGSNFGILKRSYSNCDVKGLVNVGGLVGFSEGFIKKCYSTGDITRSSGSATTFGAFCGKSSTTTVENCYSLGSVYESEGVTWSSGDKGFFGSQDNDTFINNFFDKDASNQSTGTGATGKTTTKMNQYATFNAAGWSFCPPETHSDGIWTIDISTTSPDNDGYPALFWQGLTNNYVASTPGLWTGETSSDWHTASNWDDGQVPDESVNVTIPDTGNDPVISAAASCQNITIENNSTLTINSSHTLDVSGNFTLNDGGGFINDGALRFTGNDCRLNDNRNTKSCLGNIRVKEQFY